MRNHEALTTRTMLAAALLACTLSAQTTTTTTTTTSTTTTSTNPTVTAFNVEHALTLTAINTTLTPNIPTAVTTGVGSGALELRESINYSPSNSLLTLNLFTVQAGSPLPTPPGTAATTNFSTFALKVDKVYSSVLPVNSLMFVGTVVTNTPASPFGDLTGASVSVAVGYTNDTPPKVTNAVVLVAGAAVDYTASATGTLTFASSPVGPPTTNGSGGPQIVINAPAATGVNFIMLDASGTTSPNTPLTYVWSVVTGTASITNPNLASTTAQLLGGFGQFVFQVQVTDSKGNVAQKMVTVTYN